MDQEHMRPVTRWAVQRRSQVSPFWALSSWPTDLSAASLALQQVDAAAAQLEEQGIELPNMPPPRELSDSICCLLVRLAGRPCSLLPELELASVDFAAASSRPGPQTASLFRSAKVQKALSQQHRLQWHRS